MSECRRCGHLFSPGETVGPEGDHANRDICIHNLFMRRIVAADFISRLRWDLRDGNGFRARAQQASEYLGQKKVSLPDRKPQERADYRLHVTRNASAGQCARCQHHVVQGEEHSDHQHVNIGRCLANFLSEVGAKEEALSQLAEAVLRCGAEKESRAELTVMAEHAEKVLGAVMFSGKEWWTDPVGRVDEDDVVEMHFDAEEWEWELSYGCQWNNSLSQWECHGLDGKCRWRWGGGERRPGPKDWSPRHDRPLADHHPKCEVGRKLAMKKRIRAMKVVVDPSVGRNEIRVPDGDLAEWLTRDGEPFSRRVKKEAKLYLKGMP